MSTATVAGALLLLFAGAVALIHWLDTHPPTTRKDDNG